MILLSIMLVYYFFSFITYLEQKDEAFVASLEQAVSGLASDKVKKADLPFSSKGELPVNRDNVLIFFSFYLVDSLYFQACSWIINI